MVQAGYLVLIITLIILATTRLKLHPFLTLLIAAMATGFVGGLGVQAVLDQLMDGFGKTLGRIGIIIAFGTILGAFLERSGGANAIAGRLLRLVGQHRAALAMSMTGYVVSIPVFCDSGYIILSAVNKALSRRTGIPLNVLAVALATGLYATHVFVPPTPGPLAAAAELNADIGLVLMLGLIVAIPSALAGLLYARLAGPKIETPRAPDAMSEPSETEPAANAELAFTALLLPIVLIALKSIADLPAAPFGAGTFQKAVGFVGHPIIALLIGIIVAFTLKTRAHAGSALDWVASALASAGSILLITGAGGAFGSILQATGMGQAIAERIQDWQLGILLPFVLAASLKTAQGSSTVAIITTAAIISPMATALGFDTSIARALVVLAIGAGSMVVSHVNDSYFWVVAQFSEMNTATALRSFTVATLVQGLAAAGVIAALSALLT